MGSAKDEGALQQRVLIIQSGKEKCLQSGLKNIHGSCQLDAVRQYY